LIVERFGSFANVRAIELGAGRGLNAFLFAERGSRVTLLDNVALALEQARALFDAHGLTFDAAEEDLFELPDDLLGAFDVSMSYGLCEHFLGESRLAVVAAHFAVLRPGGLALLGVPNRHGVFYRVWMKTMTATGGWPIGTEEPFTAGELRELSRQAGGEPLDPVYGSFVGSFVNHGVNQLLFKLGRKGLPVPQVQIPGLDRMAYELLLPVVKPA